MNTEKLEHLLDLAAILSQQTDFQEILRVTAQKAASLLNAETATIMMINPQTRNTIRTIMREGREDDSQQFHVAQTHVSGWIIKHQRPFASSDLKTDPSFAKNLFAGIPIKTALGVPLRVEGSVIGAIILINIDQQPATSIQYLEQLATIAAPYLRNAQKLQQYFAAPVPEATLLVKYEGLGLIGKSKKFIELLQAIEAAARCEVRVLLEGASGTGKELIARAIHRLSSRSERSFLAIDCGAIAANLIESELFGHVKGAFTGATTDRKGLLEEANGGTLFMDEIANLPIDMQAKFMRVLQEGEVRPVGSNKTRHVEVRLIVASSSSLRKLVDQQKFREDLFFRLHVYPIRVPSLDERQEDVPLLANHFLKKFASQQEKPAESFHESILDFIQQRHWAGNIRELENLVERLVTLAGPKMVILERDLLPQELHKEMKKIEAGQQDAGIIKPLYESLSEYEEQLLRQALAANNWNIAKTARELRIAEQTLRYKMGNLGIVRGQRA
ncbi:GAF domain-containing protein [candidate division KSB1 bacterium]|nr:MAG: GAF domain-containing protein [candidate division KSB1 bacterium]MBC6948154.1 GAF domain-containing protein [candidate division KSB1 bacterium]MCE7944683.1 GAF domain-containing protein [Chlorobi bacterium CHB1]MDL1873747.1 GAF domain-containing protein [Cytophagia bacterium CHB2]